MRIEFQYWNVIKKTTKDLLIPIPGSVHSFWMPNKLIHSFAPNWLYAYIPDDDSFKIYDANAREEISKRYIDSYFNSGCAPWAPHGLYKNYYHGNN